MRGKIVCDSSVIVKWLSSQGELWVEQANLILVDTREGKTDLFAPELAKYEVGNALLTSKKVPSTQVKISLATLYTLPLQFVSETEKQALYTYKLGEDFEITYYDASFVSLAKLLDATLITDNPKHQAKVKGVKVVALKNYQ